LKVRVLVTGGAGFLGQHVVARLARGFDVTSCSRRSGVDIREYGAIEQHLLGLRPDYVVHCAAHVGGIAYNEQKPVEIFEDNIRIGLNIVKACAAAKVKGLINIMPNCTYPGHLQIYREENWWDGPMHETVLTYGMPRKAMWGLAWAYKQRGLLDSAHLVLPNMYGPGDHFDPVRSHALGALIAKIHEAKRENAASVAIWGTGKPVREWLFVEDAAEAIELALLKFHAIGVDVLNIGKGEGISITDMAVLIREAVGWRGEFVYHPDRPDGAMIKVLSPEKMLRVLGWSPATGMGDGIAKTVRWYVANR